MFRYIWVAFFFIFGASVGVARPCVEDFSTVYNEASSSVARIHAIRIDPFRVLNRVQLNVGAGVFIDSTRIVTNAHIVWGASTIAVVANDAQQMATVVGADPISDIAVIQIGGAIDGTTVVRWGNSDGVKVGQDVLAIGHPVALTASATRGIISGKSRVLPITPMSWLTPLIQTDAAIFPGNSGGPLVDQCGDVIGINSMILRGRSGINFAIPSNIVQKIVAKIIKDGRVIRPWHGIHGRMINATLRPILEMTYGMHVPTGFLVETLEPGSPAEKSGLAGGVVAVNVNGQEYLIGGDIITQVNGTELESMETVIEVAQALKVGDKLTIHFLRGKQNHKVEVELPERPVLQGDLRRFSN